MIVESSPASLEDDAILIAGGGGGGESSGWLNDVTDGGEGGVAASSIIGQGTIGVGQAIISVADGGSTDDWGDGGNDGKDGIGGQGGQGFLGANSEWVSGDPGVGSDGRGGNADDSFSASGGGAGDDGAGAGGGSWSIIPATTCNSAPTKDRAPSNPGSSGDDFGSKNGAIEVWIFPTGC
jgi:hypothetical protein